MKHYLWHKSDGEIGGELTYQGGWPSGKDPSDSECTDPIAASNRAWALDQVGCTAIVEYSCACAGSLEFCSCAVDRCNDSVISEGSVTAKQAVTVCLGGTDKDDAINGAESAYDVTPASTITLKLKASVADDTEVVLKNCASGEDLIDDDVTLTFTSGVTNEVTINTPAQGLKGGVYTLTTLLVPRTRCVLRGWSS